MHVHSVHSKVFLIVERFCIFRVPSLVVVWIVEGKYSEKDNLESVYGKEDPKAGLDRYLLLARFREKTLIHFKNYK